MQLCTSNREIATHDKRHVEPLKLENMIALLRPYVGLPQVSRQTQKTWARHDCELKKKKKVYEKHVVGVLGSLPIVKDMQECFQLQLKRQLSS